MKAAVSIIAVAMLACGVTALEVTHSRFTVSTLLDDLTHDDEHAAQVKPLVASVQQSLEKLSALEAQRMKLRMEAAQERRAGGLLYFLDKNTRHRLDKLDMEEDNVAHQEAREINTASNTWKQIKAIYGPHSKLLVADLLAFFPELLAQIVFSLEVLFELGLAYSFLVFGPFVFWGLFLNLPFFLALIPFTMMASALYVLTKFAMHVPVLLLEYDPTPTQFFLISGGVLSVATVVGSFLVSRLLWGTRKVGLW